MENITSETGSAWPRKVEPITSRVVNRIPMMKVSTNGMRLSPNGVRQALS